MKNPLPERMRNRNYRHYIIRLLIFWTSFWYLSLQTSEAQNRNGAIDLSTAEDDWFNMTPSGTAFDIGNTAFTIEMWVKMRDNNANDMCFFDFYNGNKQLSLTYINDSHLRLENANLYESGTWYYDFNNFTQTTQFLNNWVHVAMVYNGSNGLRVYINGQQKIATGLSHGGNPVSYLVPSGGYTSCSIGGTSPKGIKGKMYVSEVRVWKADLSSSTISKYYDEEVNKSHPNWGNLIRYYHGTSETVSGGSTYMVDAMGNYNGHCNSNVKVRDLYPPVKPAGFNNATFNTTVTAGDCQATQIPVSWTNLRSSGYTTGNDVAYEVTRSDNNAASAYSGYNTSYNDANVTSGNKFTYTLKTYWYVNGTKYYSDDSKSDEGTVKMQYAAPSGLTASTTNCDNTIDLSWTWASSDPPKWTIQRADNSAFTTNMITITTAESGTSRSYKHVSPGADKTYYYRLFASGTDANGCTVTGTTSSVVSGSTSKPPAAPSGVTLTPNLVSKRLELTWTNPSGNNATGWKVIREKFDGTDQVSYTVPLANTYYNDADVTLCTQYRYKVAATNSCSTSGVYASTEPSGNISSDLSRTIKTLEASKGYYPSSVRLEWTVDGSLSNIDRFKIYRTLATENNYKLIKVIDNDLIFDDYTALGSTFYKYKVVAEATCNSTTIYSNELTDLGFVIPYGVANGHIEYEGGNAVEGVTVQFERSSGQSGKSLFLDGNGDYVESNSYVTSWTKADFTIEAWVKTTGANNQSILVKSNSNEVWEPGEKNMYLEDDGTLCFVGHSNQYIRSSKQVNDGLWHHVAIVWDYNTGIYGTAYAYVDGTDVTRRDATDFYAGAADLSNYTVKIGRSNFNGNGEGRYFFTGNIDEVRIWNVARTAEQIRQSYRRIINNTETGLVAYWRCDEGIGSMIYDLSKTGSDYNKRNGTFVGDVTFSSTIPSTSQLGITGVTDQYGNYSVDYIPYASGGEIFKVTPTFGQHQFSPSSRTLYVGDGAQSHNGIDFKDISSFDVSGKVTYYNSQVPVEGVSILIDGKNAVGSDNQPVRTDADGNYKISVPIGFHYLSTEKDGHIFSEGFFPPKNKYGDIEKHEFTEDLTVNFTDSTKIKVAGRVVGGTREGDKEIGFGKSKNNIGVSDIIFKLQKEGYDLEVSNDNIYNSLSLQTDPYTGEYSIEMIPEMWVVEKAGNSDYFIAPSDIPVLDLRNSLTVNTAYDSVKTEKVDPVTKDTNISYSVNSFSYHHKLNYVIRETPVINVYNENNGAFEGDTVIIYTSQATNTTDTIILGSKSPLSYPVFQMGKSYTAKIYVVETYKNPAHPAGPVVDEVPVKDAAITVNDQVMVNPVASTGKTDENGLYRYVFRAGTPSLSKNGNTSYTKTLEINGKTGNTNITWRNGNTFRAYVLGALPQEGTDFISYGPEVVEMVLRDPPGSNSYAFIEKGSTVSVAETWNMDINSNTGLDNTTHTGMLIEIGGGLAGPVSKTDLIMDSELGLEITRQFDYNGRYTRTLKFNERIETSADPEDVGSDADLYIGKSYNAFVNKTRNLKFIERSYCTKYGLEYLDIAGSDIVLGIIDGFVMDDGTSTYFVYSQAHIINEIIPNLVVQRNNLLRSSKYTVKYSFGHKYYGLNNDDNSFDQLKLDTIKVNPSADTTHLSYIFNGAATETDSVAFLNYQIAHWMNAIAMNEAEKVTAETVTNLSIDGSSGKYSSDLTESFTTDYSWKSARKINFTWNAQFASTWNNSGYSLNSTFDLGINVGRGEDNQRENSIKFGYVIDERDQGDYYSIDVKKRKGVEVFDYTDFTDNIPTKTEFINDQLIRTGVAGAVTVGKMAIAKAATALLSKSNAFTAAAGFGLDVALFTYELTDVTMNAMKTYNKMDGNTTYDITAFNIASPVFTVRGGQSRCPYEGEESSSFYVDNSNKVVKLNTATLRREIPVLDAEPAIRTNVPEDGKASFTLKLQNQSESNTDVWYKISIAENTNPDGAVLLIDGVSAERSFLVPAWQTVTKTLTLSKGRADVMNYDSIGVILHSMCQFNPADYQDDLADTVYISAHFMPECSSVDIKGMQDNWIVNYEDSNKVAITLNGYDVNHANLKKLDFQYKTLSGSPISVMSWFKDSTDYKAHTGDKAMINGKGEVSFIWDINALTDRQYMIRARTTCSDGSVKESTYYTGIIDRVTPTVFGTPEPADGILDPADDISIQFNEKLEAGLVKDHNISLKGVLNGSAVSHSTSVSFDGINDYGQIPALSFNEKSFTIEFWLQRNDATSKGTVFTKGAGSEKVEVKFNNQKNIEYTLGGNTYTIDPSSYYSAVYPADAWHHWAIVFDKKTANAKAYLDDKVIFEKTGINFQTTANDNAFIARNLEGTAFFSGKMHELRIWEKALTVNESYSGMSSTLSGSELNLYGYWPMEEGNGSIADDKTAGRNMTIKADWNIVPGSHSYSFDGTGQYLTLNGGNAVISRETDMTIEFWFKGSTPAGTSTLLSNGLGDGKEVYTQPADAVSINADPSGRISVLSNGRNFQATSRNYFDNNWHHIALVVNRKADVKCYVDGELQNTGAVSNFYAFANSKIWVGARAKQTDRVTTTTDQYFKGSIDELRIWNTARKQEHLKLYKNTKLTGNETGLVAYYPFETYTDVMGAIVLQSSLKDQIVSDVLVTGTTAASSKTESFSTTGALLKDARPVQDIPFDFVVNNDKMVITPVIDAYKIEGQILEISVRDVQDLYGNRMLSPVGWTAFIQNNEVIWKESVISLQKRQDSSLTFTATVSNLGGIAYEYTLENLPAWLTTSQSSGVIPPDSEIKITFTASNSVNTGSYEQGINLKTGLGFDEKLTVKLRVYVKEPDWRVASGKFQHTMNLVGRLIIEDVVSTDTYDKVGAFVNGECRGVANVQYQKNLDAYLLYMNIYSDSTSGEKVEFKVWDASTGNIHENVIPSVTFVANSMEGTPLSPVDIIADNSVAGYINLNKGWTWISFNLTSEKLADINATLKGIGKPGDLVKGQNQFDIFDAGSGWTGSLSSAGGFENPEMYKLFAADGGTVKYTGKPVDVSANALSIEKGWNYIGYLPQVNMSVEDALGALSPQNGDLIKGYNSFAVYNTAFGWSGSLITMKPGEGYMLYSGQTANLIYPKTGSVSAQRISTGEPVVPGDWKVVYGKYPTNMTITAVIENLPATGLSGEEILGVFAGDECRGYVKPVLINGTSVYFLTIQGEISGSLTFSLYNENTGKLTDATNILMFEKDQMVGTVDSPYALRIAENESVNITSSVAPNPFKDLLNVRVLTAQGSPVEIILNNAIGLEVYRSGFISAGMQNISLNLTSENLPAGSYILTIKTSEKTEKHIVVKY
jgi:hypothetical protein